MAVTLVLNNTAVGAGGTLAVPATCDVLISRTNTTVGGVAATGTGGGWYWWLLPPTGNQTIAGASNWIGFQNGQGGVLEATAKGWDSSGAVNEVMTGFAATTVFLGVITAHDGGPVGLKCNNIAMTYFTNASGEWGYAGSAVNDPVCTGYDDGASHGVSASFLSLDYGAPVTTTIKKVAGVAYASIKKVSGVAIASVKKISGVA